MRKLASLLVALVAGAALLVLPMGSATAAAKKTYTVSAKKANAAGNVRVTLGNHTTKAKWLGVSLSYKGLKKPYAYKYKLGAKSSKSHIFKVKGNRTYTIKLWQWSTAQGWHPVKGQQKTLTVKKPSVPTPAENYRVDAELTCVGNGIQTAVFTNTGKYAVSGKYWVGTAMDSTEAIELAKKPYTLQPTQKKSVTVPNGKTAYMEVSQIDQLLTIGSDPNCT